MLSLMSLHNTHFNLLWFKEVVSFKKCFHLDSFFLFPIPLLGAFFHLLALYKTIFIDRWKALVYPIGGEGTYWSRLAGDGFLFQKHALSGFQQLVSTHSYNVQSLMLALTLVIKEMCCLLTGNSLLSAVSCYLACLPEELQESIRYILSQLCLMFQFFIREDSYHQITTLLWVIFLMVSGFSEGY